jgi:hypothetical protein
LTLLVLAVRHPSQDDVASRAGLEFETLDVFDVGCRSGHDVLLTG